jgi:hypothetical protein
MDDRTGSLFRLHYEPRFRNLTNGTLTPVATLLGGDAAPGRQKKGKGMKAEWCTVGPDGELLVGGTGKDWTDENNVVLHSDPKWIKRVTPNRQGEGLEVEIAIITI